MLIIIIIIMFIIVCDVMMVFNFVPLFLVIGQSDNQVIESGSRVYGR